jgi:hypothetical protein
VYSATGADVRATIVNGEPVVRDFSLVRFDRDAVLAAAREAAASLARRAGVV